MATPLLQLTEYPLDSLNGTPFYSSDKTIVVLVDLRGRCAGWNHAAEALTGYSEAEMLGHPLWEVLVFPEDAEPVRREFKRILSGAPPGALEFRWKIDGGAARWMACSNFELCRSFEGAKYLAFTAIDVTDSRGSRDWRAVVFAECMRAQEAERSEISRFVHDTIAQNLVALTFNLGQSRQDQATSDSARTVDLADRCCQDIRLLVYLLATPALGNDSLAEAIGRHVGTLRESGVLDIVFHSELQHDLISPEACTVLLSAVHKFTATAVTNRAGKRLSVVLKRDGLSAVLEMKGDFGKRGTGNGDRPAIRQRVAALGGRIEMTPFSVRIAFPVSLAVPRVQ